eukprot:Colp12_sorted_trinity150504_noHs@7843
MRLTVVLLAMTTLLGLVVDAMSLEKRQLECEGGIARLVETIPSQLNLTTKVSTLDAWIELIDSAEKQIDIGAFYMTFTGGKSGELVLAAIRRAADRGVRFRIAISEPTANFPDDDLFDLLRDYPTEVIEARGVNMTVLYGSGVLHTKFIVADKKAFYIGSANLDWRSLEEVKELGVYVQNCPIMADDLQKLFAVYWLMGKATHVPNEWPQRTFSYISKNHPAIVNINSERTTAFISSAPHTTCSGERTFDLTAVCDAMRSANKSISVEVMDYQPAIIYTNRPSYWGKLDDCIKDAAFRGIEVRMLISIWEHSSPKQWPYLRSLDQLPNVHVRLMKIPEIEPQVPFTRVNHAKFMVTDQVALVTTSNWIGDYFTTTAGISFVTASPSLKRDLQGVFDRDWSSPYATLVSLYDPSLDPK